jgi:hypothetical protein
MGKKKVDKTKLVGSGGADPSEDSLADEEMEMTKYLTLITYCEKEERDLFGTEKNSATEENEVTTFAIPRDEWVPTNERVEITVPLPLVARVESEESQPGAFAIPGPQLRRQEVISLQVTRNEILVQASVVDEEQPSLVFEASPLRRRGTWKWIVVVSVLLLLLTFAVAIIFIQTSSSQDSMRGSTNADPSDKFSQEGEALGEAFSGSSMIPLNTIFPSLSPTMYKHEELTPPPSVMLVSREPSSVPSILAPSALSSEGPSVAPTVFVPKWTKIGQDIFGESDGDHLGQAVALSQDGMVVAVGSHLHDQNANQDVGRVRVYQLGKSWQQIGQDLIGNTVNEESGWAIDLSADGSILAIGSLKGGQNSEGSVRVYEYNRDYNFWEPLGQELFGGEAGSLFGGSLSLSDNGMSLVIGAEMYDSGSSQDVGRVQVYWFNRFMNLWIQTGQNFWGEDALDHAGSEVCVSGDGQVVAMGVPDKDDDMGTPDVGLVRVYKLGSGGLVWYSFGGGIYGPTENARFGLSVDVSADGRIVAASSSSAVHILHYDDEIENWMESDAQISLEVDDIFDITHEIKVDLSPDGRMIAISRASTSVSGVVQVYRLNEESTEWVKVGQNIESNVSNSVPSLYLAINGHIVVGSPNYSADGSSNRGKASVYELQLEP